MSWQDINNMLQKARKILKDHPDAMVLMDIRVYDTVGPQTEHWDMVADEQYGDNRLRIGIANRKK